MPVQAMLYCPAFNKISAIRPESRFKKTSFVYRESIRLETKVAVGLEMTHARKHASGTMCKHTLLLNRFFVYINSHHFVGLGVF